MRIKKFLLNSWVVNIGSAIVLGVGLKLYDILAGTNIFNRVCRLVLKSIESIPILLSYRISLGLILVVCIFFVCSIILYKKLLFSRITKIHPKYFDYTEDAFQGVLYRWDYICINGKYKIGSIVAYCPTCKHRIIHDKCLKCNSSFLIDKKDRQEREAMIRHGIETKYQINEFYELGK